MLGFALALLTWLQVDEDRPQLERHRRDRAIATELSLEDSLGSNRVRLQALSGWWRCAARDSQALPFNARSLERARLLLSGLLFALGLVLGLGIASAALHYDGSAPVNLVSAVAWLVLLPGILFTVTLLLLPGRLPFAGWLQDIVAIFNPGQWASQWLNGRFDDLNLGWPGGAPRYLGDHERPLTGVGRVARWQLLTFSQQLALGYALGALVCLFALITFTDMAFGWSTTLQVSSEGVARWVHWVSRPWAGLWPAASPSAELVEASRFFRAAGPAAQDVPQLGAWWPFLVMLISCYTVLPRLLLLLLARSRLRAAERRLLLEQPTVQRLLQRLTTPLAAYAASPLAEPLAEAVTTPAASSPFLEKALEKVPLQLPAEAAFQVVIWNEALLPQQLDRWLVGAATAMPPVQLGAAVSLTDEAELLATLPQVSWLVVFAKAWEPPLLDVQDLLLRLAGRLPEQGGVLVVPVGVAAALPEPADLAIWQQTLAALDDVRVQVWGAP